MRATVFSIFFPNIVEEVRIAQRKCVEKFLPKDWSFAQLMHVPELGERFPHATALERCIELNSNDLTCILDIDCIPLDEKAFPFLEKCVVQNYGKGLAGAVQRANHISNNKHLYVGPFCMAFSKDYYKELGSPSFRETERGDAGEELTYRWTERSGFLSSAGKSPYKYSSNIHFMWPTSCMQKMWDLEFGFKFGFGTTYGAAGVSPNLFFHMFNVRMPQMQTAFVKKCDEVLNKEGVLA